MKPEAQRIALLEWMGWRKILPGKGRNNGALFGNHPDWGRCQCPPLTLDLMHWAEKKIDRVKQDEIQRTEYDRYWQWLRATAGGDYVGATKEQRLEALLKTVGKWVE